MEKILRILTEELKSRMVRTEPYLLWGMIGVMGIVTIYFVWEGIDTHQTLNRIINNEHRFAQEEKLDLLNLSLTTLQTDTPGERLNYVTVTDLSYSMDREEKLEKIADADASTQIAALEYNPSFLVREGHENFWKTHFIWYLILYYGGWTTFCLFVLAFGYVNLKQDQKLLTKEIQWIITGVFFIILIGQIGYHLLNHGLINFLNSEFQLAESVGSLTSDMTDLIYFGLFLAYVIILKAVPVQEEHDLTV